MNRHVLFVFGSQASGPQSSAPNDPHVHLQGAQQHHAKEDGPEARRRTVREPDPALNGCAGKTPASD